MNTILPMLRQWITVSCLVAVLIVCSRAYADDISRTIPQTTSESTSSNPTIKHKDTTSNTDNDRSIPLPKCPSIDKSSFTHVIYHDRVKQAFSNDGLKYTLEKKILIDHASVPEAVIGPDGKPWIYFVNGQPGQHGPWVAREQEDGSFKIFSCIMINGKFEGNAVDPDIIRLPNGKYRLYYFLGHFTSPPPKPKPGEPPPKHLFYSAISDDGIYFTVEDKAIEAEGVTDPSVIRISDTNWLMALSKEGSSLLARSRDGIHFQLLKETINQASVPDLALFPNNLIRLFASGRRGISSLTSIDNGLTWSTERGTRIPGPSADPSVIKMPDGRWMMVYKTFSPNKPGPPPNKPGPPPNKPGPP